MRFNDLILIESDTELECYRLDLLDAITCNSKRIKREVETLLGAKVVGIVPVGAITNHSFSEDSDVELNILVQLPECGKLENDLVGAHFQNLMLNDLGYVVPHVISAK